MSTQPTAPDPTSKRQRKRELKAAIKKQRKSEHHASLHERMLGDARRLRTKLQTTSAAVPDASLYPSLPHASECELLAELDEAAVHASSILSGPPNSAHGDDASPQERSCRIVDRFLWRPPKYNEKYAPQELSLLFQLFRLGGGAGGGPPCDLVIDIGAGNANLSCLIALVLDVPVIAVEMESPREELRGEAWLPEPLKSRGAVKRVESLIQDYDMPDGFSNALVLGKHLCGPGTDAGIDFVRRHLDRVVGCAFATCCCCKIVGGAGALGAGTQLFADVHFGAASSSAAASASAAAPQCVPCDDSNGGGGDGGGDGVGGAHEGGGDAGEGDGNAAGGEGRKGGGAEVWADLSAAAAAAEGAGAGEDEGGLFRRVLPAVARATSWRNASNNVAQQASFATAAYPEMQQEAEFFESFIQGFRRRKLRELFGCEEEILFCSESAHSMQNRCIVSGRRLRSKAGPATPDGGDADERAAFFRLLNAQFAKYEAVLPVDLRARGLVSQKYEHDGTSLE